MKDSTIPRNDSDSEVIDLPVANPHGKQFRVPSLDGLRAMSIILVIISHQCSDYSVHKPVITIITDAFGLLGVRVFFVISGFIITLLLQEERRRSGSVSLGSFYARRSLRIFPPCYAYILFIFIVNLMSKSRAIEPPEFLVALTYTVNYMDNMTWLLSHLWSLSVEEQFYLIWPIFFVSMSEKSSRHFLLGVMVLVPLIRFASVLGLISSDGTGLTFHTVADALATGCLLSLSTSSSNYLRWIRLAPHWIMTLILIFGIGGAILWEQFDSRSAVVLAPTLVNLAIAGFIAKTTVESDSLVFRFLNLPPLMQLGRWSYSLYLWQQPFMIPVGPAKFYTTFPGNYLMTMTFALASYYLIEIPCLRLRKRLAS